jgi:hypothetical protein
VVRRGVASVRRRRKTLRVLGATTPDDAIGIAEKALGIT